MSPKLPLLSLAFALLLPAGAGAGEIITKTYTNSKGDSVSGYVYQAGSSRRSYSRSRTDRRYPAYRSSGYTYYSGRTYSTGLGYCGSGRYGNFRSSRPAVQTTRTNITLNVARPIVIGRPSHGVRVIRRR